MVLILKERARTNVTQRIFTALASIILALNCFSTALADDYRIVSSSLPPWSINDESGIFVDLVAEIEKRTKTPKTPVFLPWSRAQKMARELGDHIIFPLTRTEGREEQYSWIVDVMPLQLVFATFGTEPPDFNAAKKLASIIVHQDSPTHTYLKNQGFDNLLPVTTGLKSIPLLLQKGRADSWFVDINMGRSVTKGEELAKQLNYGPTIYEQRLYIAGSKELNERVKQAYRKAFAELKADGTYDRIMEKYIGRP